MSDGPSAPVIPVPVGLLAPDPPTVTYRNQNKKATDNVNKTRDDAFLNVNMSDVGDDEATSDDEIMKMTRERKLTERVKGKVNNRETASSVESDFD